MAKLLVQKEVRLKTRLDSAPSLEDLQECEPYVIAVELDHTRTLVTFTYDGDELIKYAKEYDGLAPYATYTDVFRLWRRYNNVIAEHLAVLAELGMPAPYGSKKLLWRFDY